MVPNDGVEWRLPRRSWPILSGPGPLRSSFPPFPLLEATSQRHGPRIADGDVPSRPRGSHLPRVATPFSGLPEIGARWQWLAAAFPGVESAASSRRRGRAWSGPPLPSKRRASYRERRCTKRRSRTPPSCGAARSPRILSWPSDRPTPTDSKSIVSRRGQANHPRIQVIGTLDPGNRGSGMGERGGGKAKRRFRAGPRAPSSRGS
jgi:hypothetical protein